MRTLLAKLKAVRQMPLWRREMHLKRKHWLGFGLLVLLALIGSVCLLLWPPSLTAEEQHFVGVWKLEPHPSISIGQNAELRWRLGSDRRWTPWSFNTKTGGTSLTLEEFRWSIQNGELDIESIQSFPFSLFLNKSTAKYSISSQTQDTIELTDSEQGLKLVLHRISEE